MRPGAHRAVPPQVRALCYGCQLAGGALAGPQAAPAGLPGSLLAVSAQLSACRTALRLFDDFAMLSYSCSYGLGPKVSAGTAAAPRPPAGVCP